MSNQLTAKEKVESKNRLKSQIEFQPILNTTADSINNETQNNN